MSNIEWNSSFCVGNEKLDNEHKELIRLYNNLHESLLNDSLEGTAITKTATLDGLVDYVTYHFTSEEGYFEEMDYPGKEKHCEQHRAFSRKVESLREDLQGDRAVLTTSLMKLLRNWIVEHIAVEDQKYTPYLKQKKS